LWIAEASSMSFLTLSANQQCERIQAELTVPQISQTAVQIDNGLICVVMQVNPTQPLDAIAVLIDNSLTCVVMQVNLTQPLDAIAVLIDNGLTCVVMQVNLTQPLDA